MASITRDRVILGLMNFGPEGPSTVRVTNMDEFKHCLDAFQGAGYDEVDTARGYAGGHQERWTADAQWKERGLKLATKWNPSYFEHGGKADVIKSKMAESLKELKTDQVNIYYLHSADRTTPFQEQLEAIDQGYRAGYFKTFGISNMTAAEVAEICTTCKYKGWVRPTVYQGPYNLINRSPEAELIPVLRRFGLDYVVYNPIAGGLLTPKYKTLQSGEAAAEGRFSDAIGPVGKAYRERYLNKDMFNGIKMIEDAAQKHGLQLLDVAYLWLLHHSALNTRSKGKAGNDGIIIGASSIDQLNQNLTAIEGGPLPDDIVQACEIAWAGIKGSAPAYWAGKYAYTYDTLKALYDEEAL